MKRDMDLVRAILFAVEQNPSGFAPRTLKLGEYAQEQIGYHAYIMMDAGLVEGANTTHMGSPGPEAKITRLTWAGHEFLDAAREPARWEQAKAILHKAGGASIDVWKQVLTQLMAKTLGISD